MYLLDLVIFAPYTGYMFRPPYHMTETLLSRITRAESIRSRIVHSIEHESPRMAIRAEALTRRAFFSMAIEGSPSTLAEAQALAVTPLRSVREHPRRQLANCLRMLRWMSQRPPGTPTDKPFVLALHQLLTDGIADRQLVGRYKASNRVVCLGPTLIHDPPGPKRAKRGMRALYRWLENPAASLHPVVVSAIVHAEVARLHPFAVGNGPMARALAHWVLVQHRFDPEHLLVPEQHYHDDREGYLEALYRAHRMPEDLTLWIEYAALAVLEALQRTWRRIEQLTTGGTASADTELTHQQQRMVSIIEKKGALTVRELQQELDVERVQVYRIIRPLLNGHLLTKSVSRPVIYRLSHPIHPTVP